MAGDREDGRDGVEREDNIGKFNGDQGEEENGCHATAVLDDEEMVLAEADGVDFREPANPGRGLFTMGRGHDETDGGYEQDGCEDIADPGKAVEQADAGGDECAAHDDRPQDSPEEDAGLFEGLDLEQTEEQKEDEEIVYRERLFDSVSGEIFDGVVAADCEEDEKGECQGRGDPEDGGDDSGMVGLGRRGRGIATTAIEELDREENKQKNVEADPMADGGAVHVSGHVTRMISRGAISKEACDSP